MKVKIVGFENMKYDFDNVKFEGRKFHAIDIETESSGLTGQKVTTFKMDKDHPMYTVPITPGKVYTVYFDQKKNLDFIQECSPAPVK